MAVRASGGTDPPERVNRLVVRHEARFRQAFLDAIATITDAHTLEELIELLQQGRTEEALATLQEGGEILAATSVEAFVDAARSAARFLSDNILTTTIRFDVVNIRAVQAMAVNRLDLIREFTAEQRRVTRDALIAGIEQGLNPRDQARRFRDSIGLTSRQLQSVDNYRRLLSAREGLPSREALARALRDGRSDRSIERALRDGTPLPQAQIDSMVERYTQRFLRYRSEVIARTEALRSVHQGNRELYDQAIESGRIRRDELQREWVTSIDGRERPSHFALNGLVRGHDETFPGFDGPLRYPGDPEAPASETAQCRCGLATRIVPQRRDRQIEPTAEVPVSDRPDLVAVFGEPATPTAAQRVFDALEQLGEDRTFVALADLREALPDLSRADLDQALRRFQSDGNLQLQPFEQDWLVSDRDRDASVDVDGQQTHLITVGRRPVDLGARRLPTLATPEPGVLAPTSAAPVLPSPVSTLAGVSLEDRIRQVTRTLPTIGRRVRIADLREALPDVSAEELTAELRRLSRARQILLEPEDNPVDITDRDRESAITLGGQQNIWFLLRE